MAIVDAGKGGLFGMGDDTPKPVNAQFTEEVVALEESKNEEDVKRENLEFQSLVSFIKNKFSKAKHARRFDEQRWTTAYNNYRGLYGPDTQWSDTEKSRVFIKITKTKVQAAYAQILDILFANQKFPIGIEPSKVPEGVAESVHFDPQAPSDEASPEGPPSRTATIAREDILKELGSLKKQLEPVQDKLKPGPGLTPTSYTFEPAKEAAKKMEKKIHDQLEESHAEKGLRRFVFDACLFGTGVFKGPFASNKEYPNWNEKGEYIPKLGTIANVEYVSVWDAYPDPDARCMEEAEHFIQRHKMSRTQLRGLKKRPHFRSKSIDLAIQMGPDYHFEYWENDITDSDVVGEVDRFEVLEYWGYVDKELAEDYELEIPKSMEDLDQLQVNIWICNDQILRLVLNPFIPNRIPFFACPYELNPYSFFGVGVAENMEDTQLVMNGFMRLAVDNAALSSNIVFEVDENMLVPGQDMKIFPGKIFRRAGGAPGQSIFATKFPNVTQECMLMFDKARQLADEATGMPSYSHGISGVMGVGRTASGMSMLMGAAKENIKSVVRNIDDYLLVPLGKALFAFNMQFNFDKELLGDVEVVARGTESLMRNEVRSQKLLQFLQMTANQLDAPFVKRDYVLRELAAALDLEADKVVNDPREAAIQATIMAEMQKTLGPIDGSAGMMIQGGNPASLPGTNDPTGTGGGNIAPGMSPTPGEAGNSGMGGGSMQAAMASKGQNQG